MRASVDRARIVGHRVAVLVGVLAVLGGSISLIGWIFNIPRLTDWEGDGISMMPNASLCAALLGLAIILLARRQERAPLRVVRALAGTVLAIALVTLFEHLAGVNVGIDTLIVNRDWGHALTLSPMRMGIPGSLSFAALALTILLLTGSARHRSIAGVVPLLPIAISLLSLIGYWFGAESLYGIAAITGIASQTSCIILGLAVGTLALAFEIGIVGLMARDDPGGQVFRLLLLPVIVIPWTLGWLCVLGEQAHLFETAFGVAVVALLQIFLFCGLLYWTSHRISRHAQEASTAEGRLAAIVQASDDAIISTTTEGIITSWNAGAERMFGYTPAEAIGQSVNLVIPPDRQSEESQIVGRLQRREHVRHYDTIRRRKDGTGLSVSLSVAALWGEDGQLAGLSKTARDITERCQSEQILRTKEQELRTLAEAERKARAVAEQASLMKDEFLATLSHELRTPLNAILGWAQLLLIGDSPAEEQREGLETIERNARLQAQLIADLLDMSRIISGKIRIDVQRVDLPKVVEQAFESVRPSAEAKQVRFRKIIDPKAGPIAGDPTRIQQVLWNLLTNAIKFTPKEGRVEIVLERVNSHVEISVVDSGIGIAAEDVPVVFDRFRQVDSSTTRHHGGLGLGLSIVKSLVDLHGGTVSVTSPGKDQGATFRISLPLMPVEGDPYREHPVADRLAPLAWGEVELRGLRVLVVDDAPDARQLVQRLLMQSHAEVTIAATVAQALESMKTTRYHAIVSDIGMPGQDGYHFIREVRKLAPTDGGATPAIALTAFARTEDRTRALREGFQMHLAKPIQAQELLVAVSTLASRNGRAQD
jgi:PAS domain S-box-containing protein